MSLRLARWIFCILLLSSLGLAQTQRFNIGVGGGFTMPTGRAGDSLNTGWNLNVRGGYNFSPQFAADLDFTYNHSDLI
jgi:Outer membrane protein beta-barrel domain